MSIRIEQHGDDVLIAVKAVPGASRDEVAGAVGDRLKVRVSAPAEGGRANNAILRALARALRMRPGQLRVESGETNPEKMIRIAGAEATSVRRMLE